MSEITTKPSNFEIARFNHGIAKSCNKSGKLLVGAGVVGGIGLALIGLAFAKVRPSSLSKMAKGVVAGATVITVGTTIGGTALIAIGEIHKKKGVAAFSLALKEK